MPFSLTSQPRSCLFARARSVGGGGRLLMRAAALPRLGPILRRCSPMLAFAKAHFTGHYEWNSRLRSFAISASARPEDDSGQKSRYRESSMQPLPASLARLLSFRQGAFVMRTAAYQASPDGRIDPRVRRKLIDELRGEDDSGNTERLQRIFDLSHPVVIVILMAAGAKVHERLPIRGCTAHRALPRPRRGDAEKPVIRTLGAQSSFYHHKTRVRRRGATRVARALTATVR